MFFSQPFGTFDFTGAQSKFLPASRKPLCVDIFLRCFAQSRDDFNGRVCPLTDTPKKPALLCVSAIASYISQPREVLTKQNIP